MVLSRTLSKYHLYIDCMKVITQLVQHFWSRQALSDAQAQYLVSQGFVRATDLPGFEFQVPIEKEPSSFKFKKPLYQPRKGDSEQDRQDKLVDRGPSKKSRGKPKGTSLTEKDLAKSVQTVLDRRGKLLEILRRWAEPLGRTDDWVAATVRIRQASDTALLDVLAKSIRKQSVALGDLWTALDLEPLYALVDSPDIRGNVPRAFRALLTTDGLLPAQYTFLLKLPPLEAAKNLATAHRRYCYTLRQLHDGQPKLAARALTNAHHPVVVWALTLLYNARRKPLNAPMQPKREFEPSALPAPAIWRQAWTAALEMDEPAVTQLLIESYKDEQGRTKREPAATSHTLLCPLDWRLPN